MTDPDPFHVIIPTGDGEYLVHLPEATKIYSKNLELLDADTREPLTATHLKDWWLAKVPPERVAWPTTKRTYSDRYHLIKPELHAVDPDRWPTEIDSLWGDGDEQAYADEDYARTFYDEPVEEIWDLTNRIPVPEDWSHARIPEGWWTWETTIPGAALYPPELRWWLPGRLVGFRAHMATLLDARPGVTDVYCRRPSRSYEPSEGPYFNVRLPWSDGRTATSGKGRNRRQTRTWITHKVSLNPVPLVIYGRDVWMGISNWETEEARWLNEWDMLGAEACAHCGGRGYLIRGDATPSPNTTTEDEA